MPKQIVSLFDCYEFDEREKLLAFVFPDMNLLHIKNERAVAANRKILIKVGEDNDVRSYELQQKYWEGYIEALSYLIHLHEDNTAEMREQIAVELEEARRLAEANPDLNQT